MGCALRSFNDVADAVILSPEAVSFLGQNVGPGHVGEDILFSVSGIGLQFFLYAKRDPQCEADIAFTLARFTQGASGKPFLGHPNFSIEQFLDVIDSFKDVKNKAKVLLQPGVVRSLGHRESNYRGSLIEVFAKLTPDDSHWIRNQMQREMEENDIRVFVELLPYINGAREYYAELKPER